MHFAIATGGFRASARVDEETKEIFELSLSFELANWEYYESDYETGMD